MPLPLPFGPFTLDGDLSDWSPDLRLDADAIGTPGYAIYGDVVEEGAVFAISAAVPIGENTTIWLDTDMDRATGHQIWGFTGGAEYNIQIAADGTAGLYTGGAGEILVAPLDVRYNADRTVMEVAVSSNLVAFGDQVRVFADVNDSVFLPNDYTNVDLVAGTVAAESAIAFDAYTLDGDLSDWSEEQRLDTGATGVAGYAIYGDVVEEGAVFAISAAVPIGENTTIWLDTDMDRATGHQIWGFTGGAEYNIQIAADGSAALYTGGAGQTLVAELEARFSADRTLMEVAVPQELVGFAEQVRVFADVNDSVFLPNDYANVDLIAGTPDQLPDDPGLRVGIVYSETTAANWFDITAYGQLVMSAQNQAMQAGVPFDLLGEADLLDPAALAQYDALIFPGMANVRGDMLEVLTTSLTTASTLYGVGLIAAGNFLTNDETGAPMPGNSYARMQDLLGVTLEGFGETERVDLVAGTGGMGILEGYADGEVVGRYDVTSFLHFQDLTGGGEVLFEQVTQAPGATPETHDAVIATEVGARNVHFATDAIIGNSNILQSAIDWVAQDDAPDVSLRMTRSESLFYARNDMDLSQWAWHVIEQEPGIYDVMLPIAEAWQRDYGFVGSYYVNVGANPPDSFTDWSVSGPLFQQLLAAGNEIGTHTYTHPYDTNLLQPDSPELLELLARIDPSNPDATEPWELTEAERTLLFESFRFQFETSKLEIEQALGITVTGAAVPGAPEKLPASEQIIRFFDYMSGGYSGEGAGYPNAFGFLTPELAEKVYLAPNMSFDFALLEFLGLSLAEAEAVWADEYDSIISHAAAPIIAFPWHDYGPTEWSFEGEVSPYTAEIYETVLARAAADGTEFVTGEDLAGRIESFAATELRVTGGEGLITAEVVAEDAGRFALEVGDTISSVSGWYAWDGAEVFLPQSGGTFEIVTSGPLADVTRLSDLPDRSELLSATGDGSDLSASFAGRGTLEITLRNQGSEVVRITGDGAVDAVEDGRTVQLSYANDGPHSMAVSYFASVPQGTVVGEALLGGQGDDALHGGMGQDTLFGGLGSDTFEFYRDAEGERVLDFKPGEDRLAFDFDSFSVAYGIDRIDQLLDGFADTAAGALLRLQDTDIVTLNGVASADLTTADISFLGETVA